MFSFLGKLFAKISISEIARNLILDIDTVKKPSGVYLRIRIELYNFKLLDQLFPVSEIQSEVDPVDINYSAKQEKKIQELDKRATEQAQKILNQ